LGDNKKNKKKIIKKRKKEEEEEVQLLISYSRRNTVYFCWKLPLAALQMGKPAIKEQCKCQ
jgi:hypothetical protein